MVRPFRHIFSYRYLGIILKKATSGSGSPAGTGRPTLECAPLVLAQSAPDASVLPGLNGPLEAGIHYLAASANALGLFDLEEGWPGVSDREKQFRVFIQTSSATTPIHADHFLLRPPAHEN